MSFAYPLGLLGLLCIPVLVLIYIIKSKYTEQTISSTYLWELSERFLKRKRPISKMADIISLILQILIVVAISLTIASPTFIVPNSAKEYCFILDGSGSMNTEVRGETRFDRAKNEIKSLINSSQSGSNYALVYIGDTTYTVFDGINNKKTAGMFLDDLDCGWSGSSCLEGVTIAQSYFDKNPSTIVYLVTDKDLEGENITVVNVSKHEENYAIVDYNCAKKYSAELNSTYYSITGSLFSYESDAELTLELYVEDGQNGGEKRLADTQTVSVKKLETAEFEFVQNITSYHSFEVRIQNEDAFMKDNSVVFYEATTGDTQPTLLVGADPFYLEAALMSIGNVELEIMYPEEYEDYYEQYKNGEGKSYGLYVFDCYEPTELPQGGAVWLVNARASIPKASFSFQRIVNDDDKKDYYEAEFASGNDQVVSALTKGLIHMPVAVKKYARYAVSNSSFTTVLSCAANNNPLILAGVNENNDKEVLFTFDLRDSNLALRLDYLILLKNLYRYSLPSVLNETMYTTGDTLTVNVLNGCTALVLTSPSGKITPLVTGSRAAETILTESGSYFVTATINDAECVYSFYAGVPVSEIEPDDLTVISISGTPGSDFADGYYDEIIVYLILLCLFFMADWGVYCYEQYQLR